MYADLPGVPEQPISGWPYLKGFVRRITSCSKAKQIHNIGNKMSKSLSTFYKSRSMLLMCGSSTVMAESQQCYLQPNTQSNYVVKTEISQLIMRRNQHHLRVIPRMQSILVRRKGHKLARPSETTELKEARPHQNLCKELK